jgi:hypothetical protein
MLCKFHAKSIGLRFPLEHGSEQIKTLGKTAIFGASQQWRTISRRRRLFPTLFRVDCGTNTFDTCQTAKASVP